MWQDVWHEYENSKLEISGEIAAQKSRRVIHYHLGNDYLST